jgi:hypothetical protein
MKNCPICNGRNVGQIGADQYYCWNCLIEYDGKNRTFEVQEDGSLLSLD